MSADQPHDQEGDDHEGFDVVVHSQREASATMAAANLAAMFLPPSGVDHEAGGKPLQQQAEGIPSTASHDDCHSHDDNVPQASVSDEEARSRGCSLSSTSTSSSSLSSSSSSSSSSFSCSTTPSPSAASTHTNPNILQPLSAAHSSSINAPSAPPPLPLPSSSTTAAAPPPTTLSPAATPASVPAAPTSFHRPTSFGRGGSFVSLASSSSTGSGSGSSFLRPPKSTPSPSSNNGSTSTLPISQAAPQHRSILSGGDLSAYEFYRPGSLAGGGGGGGSGGGGPGGIGGWREAGEGGLGVGTAAKMMDYNSITPPVKMMAELKFSSQRHLSLYKTASKSSMQQQQQQQQQSQQPGGSGSGAGSSIGGSSSVNRQSSNNSLVATAAGKVGGGVGVDEKGTKAAPAAGGGGLSGSKSGGSGAGQPPGDGNETTSIAKKRGIIHPYSLKRKTWDFIILLVLVYNALVIPYRVSFGMDNEAIVDDFFGFNCLTDILFILDLIFNFFTGWVTEEGVVLMDHRVIVKNYLTSWFVVDLVSSIPFDVMIYYIAQHQNLGRRGDTLKFLEMVRMARFYKLSRLLRLFRFVGVFTRLRGGFFLTHTSSNIIKFIIFSIFAMHWSACLFLSLDRDHCPAEFSWIEVVGLGGANAVDVYVASLYWSMATFMTIGYGDISARCTTTRAFSMVVMLLGSSMYAYSLNYLMTYLNSSILRASNITGDRMDAVNSFVHFRNLPPKLRGTVHEYFQKINSSFQSKEQLQNERDVLGLMAPWLRDDVIGTINKAIVRSIPIFDKLIRANPKGGAELLQRLVDIMCARVFRPDELVIKEGKVSDRIYILAKGRVEVVKWGKVRVAVLETGAFFGEGGFLRDPCQHHAHNVPAAQRQRWASIIGRTYCDIRYISRAKFEEALHFCPDVSLEDVQILLAERYAEVLRDQAELEGMCLHEFPAAKEAYERELAQEMLEDHAVVLAPHEPEHHHRHHHHHHHVDVQSPPSPATPVAMYEGSHDIGAARNSTSAVASLTTTARSGGEFGASHLRDIGGSPLLSQRLVPGEELHGAAGGGNGDFASSPSPTTPTTSSSVEMGESGGDFIPADALGQNVFDAGVWRSVTARKEHKRYVRSTNSGKHHLSHHHRRASPPSQGRPGEDEGGGAGSGPASPNPTTQPKSDKGGGGIDRSFV